MTLPVTSRRLALGFALPGLLTLVLGLLAIRWIVALGGSATTLAHDCVPSVVTLDRVIASNLAGLRAAHRAALRGASDAAADEKEFLVARARGDAACVACESLIVDAEETRLFATARARRDECLRRIEQVFAALRAGRGDDAVRLLHEQAEPAVDACNDDLGLAVAHTVRLAEAEMRSVRSSLAWSRGVIRGGLVVVLLLGMLIGRTTTLAIRRSRAALIETAQAALARMNRALTAIASSIEAGAVQTAASSVQLAAASRALADGCGAQRASVTETSASLEQITAMIRSTAENATQAKALAGEAREAAEAGRRTMTDMDAAMLAIETSGTEVAKIVKQIDEIAFQTNILAINATVEAARAGEAGTGFAVVAEEVRSLALRSAAAARESAACIEAAIASTRRGVTCCGGTHAALDRIAGKVAAADVLVAEIAAAAREQSQGIRQIGAAMAQIDSVTQANATGAEQTSGAVEQLRAHARSLQQSVGGLRALVDEAERGRGGLANAEGSRPATPSARSGSPRKRGRSRLRFFHRPEKLRLAERCKRRGLLRPATVLPWRRSVS